MSKLLKTLNNNVRRYADGKSAYWLAQNSGLSNSQLSRMFNEENSPRIDVLESLASALNIEPYLLLKEEEERNVPTDILEMLEGQPESVYESIRTILKTFNSVGKNERKKTKI